MNGEEKLMSLQQGFPVSHSVLLAHEWEQQMTVISGQKCCEQLTKYNHVGLLVKTLLESSQWYCRVRKLRWQAIPIYSVRVTYRQRQLNSTSLKESVKILKQSDMKFSRLLFRLAVAGLPTEETESGLLLTESPKRKKHTQSIKTLLPTPNASEGSKSTKKYNPQSQMGRALNALAQNNLLPTPQARNFREGSLIIAKRGKRKRGRGWSPNLNDLAVSGLLPRLSDNQIRKSFYQKRKTIRKLLKSKLLPTPVAISDAKGGCTRKNNQFQEATLAHLIHGIFGMPGTTSQLAPPYVSEMMGYPPNYLLLPFLDGAKKQ